MGEEQKLESEGGPKPGDTPAPQPESDGAEAAAAQPEGPPTPGQRLAAKKAAKAQKKKELKDELKRQQEEAQAQKQQQAILRSRPGSEPALPEDVAVVARTFSDFVYEKRGLILTAIGAFVALSVAVVVGQHFMDAGNAQAAGELGEALKLTLAPLDPDDTDGKTDLGGPVFKTAQERAEKAAEAYAKVAKQSDRPVAGWARVAEGAARLQLGAADQAQALFDAQVADSGSNLALKRRALEGAGLAFEAAGDADAAEKRFSDLKGLDDGEGRDLGEYHLARLALAKGERDAAKDLLKGLYDRLSDRPEGSPPSRYLRGEVSARLAEIDSSLVEKEAAGVEQQFTQEQLEQLLERLKSQGGGAPAPE